MDEFRRSQLRYERKLGKQVMDMGQPFNGTLHLPKKEEPAILVKNSSKKNSDEIEINCFVGGKEISLLFEARIGSTLMSSQITEAGLGQLFTKILAETFGKVTLK